MTGKDFNCLPAPARPPAGAVTGRFAPTPSGRMHLGNLFTALLAWLSARSAGGAVLLRIEDLDPARCRPGYAALLMEDLAWFGLDWDRGPAVPRAAAGLQTDDEFFQSRRAAFYQAQLDRLDGMGLVYPCFCSRAMLHAADPARAPHPGEDGLVYGGRCRGQPAGRAAAMAKARAPALRVRVPDETIAFTDGCQGRFEQNLTRDCGDFILRRSDGVFAYQLAAPADDGAQGVTEVVRGRDLLPSTPRQIWLMQTLGYTPPRYCHTPLLLAPNGRRLSKREKALDMGALRQAFKDPRALAGHLAHLAGLLPRAEPAAPVQLVPLFGWGRVARDNIVVGAPFL